MKCSTSKASSVAAWSFSSSATSPRQKSLEIDLGTARSARGAKVDLPEPGGADEDDEDELGDVRGTLMTSPFVG